MPNQTGPTTPEGKRISARNSLRHGLYAGADAAAGNEPEGDWLAFHDAIVAALEPASALERSLASRAAALLWRLRRVPAAEAAALNRAAAPELAMHAGLDEIIRIEARLNRQLLHALHELEVLRDRRRGKPTPLAHVMSTASPAHDVPRRPSAPPTSNICRGGRTPPEDAPWRGEVLRANAPTRTSPSSPSPQCGEGAGG